MPELVLSDVTRIARDAALEYKLPLEVTGAVRGQDSSYVEILVSVDDCEVPPCRFAIGIFRDSSEPALRREIASRFHQYLHDRQ